MKSFEKRELTTEEKEAKLDGYMKIKFIFGKHKGKTVDEIHSTDPKYLMWLRDTYKVNEKTSPTMMAILKYCKDRV
jgi:hypothetical protein